MEETKVPLLQAYQEKHESFVENAVKAESGNQAAGVRARKISREIEKMMKEYRKQTLQCMKAIKAAKNENN